MDISAYVWHHAASKRNMLLVAVALSLLGGLAMFADLPEVIPVVAFPWVGWHASRAFRISALGTALLVVTLEFVTAYFSLMYRSVGSVFDFVWMTLLAFPCLGSLLGSVVVFLYEAFESPAQRRRNLLAAAAACLLTFLWWGLSLRAGAILNEWSLQHKIARSGISEVIAELNRVTERGGQAPEDEQDLVQLLGRPLPDVPGRGPIQYHATGGTHYLLTFGYDLGGYVFDSEKPNEGWHLDLPGQPLL